VDAPDEVAAIMGHRRALGLTQGMVVAQPVSLDEEMDRGLHDRTLDSGLAAAARAGIRGKDVTPFLLSWFHQHSGGKSLSANVALVVANAGLAARIASADKVRRS
jgi:pseudouridine-5'-phosphate glycosidase